MVPESNSRCRVAPQRSAAASSRRSSRDTARRTRDGCAATASWFPYIGNSSLVYPISGGSSAALQATAGLVVDSAGSIRCQSHDDRRSPRVRHPHSPRRALRNPPQLLRMAGWDARPAAPIRATRSRARVTGLLARRGMGGHGTFREMRRDASLLDRPRPAERPIPPFEQLRRVPQRSPWAVRMPYAWAATIVVALGIGYSLRSPQPAPPSLEEQHLSLRRSDTQDSICRIYGNQEAVAAQPSASVRAVFS